MKSNKVSFRDDNRQTARAAIANSLSNGLTVIVGVIMLQVTTRLLEPADMGLSVSFTSTRNICLIIFSLAIYTAQYRGLLEFKEERHLFLTSIMISGLLCVLVSFLILLPFKGLIITYLELTDFLFYWLFISVALLMLRTLGVDHAQYYNRYIMITLFVLTSGPLPQFLSIAFILLQEKDLYIGRIIGLDLLNCLMGIGMGIFVIWKGKIQCKKKYVKYALGISIPLVPHLLAQLALSQSDILMIRYMRGAGNAGIYSMAYTIGMTLYSILVQLMSAWSPWVYRRLEEHNTQTVYQNSRIMILIGFICSAGMILVGPEIIFLFLSKDYYSAVYLLPSIVVGMFFQFIYLFFYDVEYYHKSTSGIAISSVIAAALNIVLNLIFVRKVGYMAAGYTTAVGYLVLGILHYFYMRKVDKRKIYSIKLIVVLSITLVSLTVMSLLLIKMIIARYLILAVITGGIAIRYFSEVKNMVKMLLGK